MDDVDDRDDAGGTGGGDALEGLVADLSRWAAGVRADDAAGARTRERWLRHQAEEEALFAGVALDLAESGAGVGIRTTAGRALHGRIMAVARDFCVLRQDSGTVTLVALHAVATLRPEPGYRAGEAASDRAAPVRAGLADVLAALAGDRPRVRLVAEGASEGVTGELRSVGADVATVRLEGAAPGGGDGRTVYVRLESVREVTLLG